MQSYPAGPRVLVATGPATCRADCPVGDRPVADGPGIAGEKGARR